MNEETIDGWLTRMRLETRGGSSIELSVIGYQFAAGDDEFDVNWLVIRGCVEAGDQSWVFEDPCLLTFEARTLGSWLRHVANPLAEYERLAFLEPNLGFDVAIRTDSTVTIRFYFDLEARPTDSIDVGEDSCWIDLEVRPEQLIAASEAWLSELGNFPARKP